MRAMKVATWRGGPRFTIDEAPEPVASTRIADPIDGTAVVRYTLDRGGHVVVRIDPRYFRPTEVDLLIGDPSKAKRQLGWTAQTSFDDLVRLMCEADRSLAAAEAR